MILLLQRPGDANPSLVVKITQEPRFNDRLLNEATALRALAEQRLVALSTIPKVVLTTAHSGCAVVVETAQSGTGFRHRSSGTFD